MSCSQIIHRITFVNPPAITPEWKRKVAQDAIESLSAAKLARSICSQFRTRLNSSHEAFAASLRQVKPPSFYLKIVIISAVNSAVTPDRQVHAEYSGIYVTCMEKKTCWLIVLLQYCKISQKPGFLYMSAVLPGWSCMKNLCQNFRDSMHQHLFLKQLSPKSL